jgi:hypothetical protein
MAEPHPLFRTLAVEPDPPPAPAPQLNSQANAVAIHVLKVALSAIWQQFVIAIAHLFTLASAGSCFVLWLLTPDPNTKQLVALGMYAGFVLAANMQVLWSRRK